MSNKDNNDDFLNDDNSNNNNPFGIDPEEISSMINNLLGSGQGGSGFGFAPQFQVMGQGLNEGPMGIAKRVAADIASRDIPDDINEQNDDVPNSNQDPMAEIMQILSLLSAPAKNTQALKIDDEFASRCDLIFPAAQSYVAKQTDSPEITSIPLVVTDRVSWTKDYINSMEGPLEVASKSLSPSFGEQENSDLNDSNQQSMGFDIQSMISKTVAPMMFGVQAGTMLGYLSHRAYGDDDVLLPAKLPIRVSLIASAVQKFCEDWSIPTDEAILYFLILQSLRAQIRSKSWLTQHLDDLCTRYVGAYELNPYKLEELMGDMNIENPESLTAINVTPEQMFATLRTPTHDLLDEEIIRITSLHDAYVEWVMHKELETLLPNYRVIQEARRRIVVTTSDADRFVEQLFGVATSRKSLEIASEFITGVIERDGEKYLHQMWTNKEMIPTQPEFAAPGLWLARLEVMDLN